MSWLTHYDQAVKNVIIDLLIGNDYYADIVSMRRITLKDGLYLLVSKLGWIFSCRTQSEDSSAPETHWQH